MLSTGYPFANTKRSATMDDQYVPISKFLSLVLRHQPEQIELRLDKGGWADVEELILKSQKRFPLSRALLEEVVRKNDKKRFSFSADGKRIRANQGHSLQHVRLDISPSTPPQILYHGTARRFLDSILEVGLMPQGRQHVHLSIDAKAAMKVGRRHGDPIVLRVAANRLVSSGHVFYLSENGVWLTSHVPAVYLTIEVQPTPQ